MPSRAAQPAWASAMRAGLSLLVLLALAGCPETPWCHRLNEAQQRAARRTCVFADELSPDLTRPYSPRDGSPVAFVTAARPSPRQADGPGGMRLTGHPWGLAWRVASGAGDPSGWDTVRRDSVGSVLAVAVGGGRYALAMEDGRVLVMPLASPSGAGPQERWDGVSITLHNPALRLELSPGGNVLVTVDRVGRAEAWDVPSGARRWSVAGGLDPHVAIAPDGLHVATVSNGTTALLLDARSGEPVASWAFPDRIEDLVLTAGGEYLVVRMAGRPRAAPSSSRTQHAEVAPVRRQPSVVSVWRLR